MLDEIITNLHELQLGMPSRMQDIAEEIQLESVGLALQIRNCGFLVEEFLVTIGIPNHCIESMLHVLHKHGYLHPESIASLNRDVMKKLDLKLGLRVKLLRGVVLLRYLGYHSQPSG
jgi:hypothetical protein